MVRSLPEWIKIKNPVNQNYKQLLSSSLDAGEASAIALAFEIKNVLLILDDLKGRQEAERFGFKITGTLGVLYKAKQSGLIEKIKPSIESLIASGFRISQNVVEDLLRQSKEFT